mmetsp:Transcript_107651/g.229853  ORF Transcript_107651/g.229853 Transcript_107651/m.229853 type:complete len:358 (-) Transcript_107651:67-1140(-)
MASTRDQGISEGTRPSPVRCAVASTSGAVPVSSKGVPSRFSNAFWEGTTCLVHRLPDGSVAEPAHSGLLDISGPPAAVWELQIQGRFKVMPRGPVLVGAELRDAPMQLGMFTRACARVMLKLAKAMASQRGVEFRYAFGEEGSRQKPHMAGPIMKTFRMFRSDVEMPMPVLWPGTKGTWHVRDGEYEPVDRGSDFFDTTHWFTFVVNTAYVDWHAWKAVHLPALKALDLGLFWGNQSAHCILFDEGGEDGQRRYFFEMEIKSPEQRMQAAAVSTEKESVTSVGTHTPEANDALFDAHSSNGDEDGCEGADEQLKVGRRPHSPSSRGPADGQDITAVEAPGLSCLSRSCDIWFNSCRQ